MPGGGRAHLDLRAQQRHPALRRRAGQQGREAGAGGRPAPAERPQRPCRQGHLQGGRRRAEAQIRAGAAGAGDVRARSGRKHRAGPLGPAFFCCRLRRSRRSVISGKRNGDPKAAVSSLASQARASEVACWSGYWASRLRIPSITSTIRARMTRRSHNIFMSHSFLVRGCLIRHQGVFTDRPQTGRMFAGVSRRRARQRPDLASTIVYSAFAPTCTGDDDAVGPAASPAAVHLLHRDRG